MISLKALTQYATNWCVTPLERIKPGIFVDTEAYSANMKTLKIVKLYEDVPEQNSSPVLMVPDIRYVTKKNSYRESKRSMTKKISSHITTSKNLDYPQMEDVSILRILWVCGEEEVSGLAIYLWILIVHLIQTTIVIASPILDQMLKTGYKWALKTLMML